MKSTYSVTEAQAGLPKLLRQSAGRLVTIEKRGVVTAYIVSRARMEAIVETMELLADSECMENVRKHRAGKLKTKPFGKIHV
ncbi:MAG: type II toxin-antitoxin system Phd/YefM family antitoxin [Opitutaceae bacterium]|jgi:antitoxin YefM|nr:type II toxin-antitoxin system Phd/YefM family antitoxin [Opitutaceae bacterium]